VDKRFEGNVNHGVTSPPLESSTSLNSGPTSASVNRGVTVFRIQQSLLRSRFRTRPLWSRLVKLDCESIPSSTRKHSVAFSYPVQDLKFLSFHSCPACHQSENHPFNRFHAHRIGLCAGRLRRVAQKRREYRKQEAILTSSRKV
jgi:hypothetical protein